MRNFALLTLLWILVPATSAFADNQAYSGPFFMCPDAHGDEQKSLFRLIDITKLPMRIEGMGQRRVDGFAASLAASRSAAIMSGKDPIDEAFEKLFGMPNTMAADHRRLVAVCFATQPPPATDTDGPFLFMPGFFIDDPGDVLQPLDTVIVPAQTYLVTTFTGPASELGNLRFTLTEEFWRKTAPFLGLERTSGPNLMVWSPGEKGNEPSDTVEMWTPIKPFRISPP
ncbi:GyrI-like domain-containing protein [Mesorhizobium sp. INR15]|uniref:GyrI-like domain-containing protein n=1 Tax=Mesorhizobium sp. INR15 TaxID=2654248 RepID=UPI001896A006|nr:hypothetical protein [Mesorhizobium sp. INR15]QPC89719.1 hypothetical protein GA829_03450 [Mesorhizobium sp. INR15]